MEEWRPAKGFEEYFEVSSLGRVKSLPRRVFDIARGWVVRPEEIIATDGKTKYKTVGIRVGRKRKTISVHRLIAETFIPNPENLPVVNHIDGNTWNNAVENLEWVTIQDNVRHAYRTGLVKKRPGASGDGNQYIIVQYDKSFRPVAEYPTISEAERATGIKNISAARAKCKLAGGYYWEYKTEGLGAPGWQRAKAEANGGTFAEMPKF